MLPFVDTEELRDEDRSGREATFSAHLQKFARRSSCEAKNMGLPRERPAIGVT